MMVDQDVISTLRTLDKDRYLATLFMRPEAVRADVTALYAFGAEVAAIPGRVSEPGPGDIRLQWWRDALEGVEHGAVHANPMAAALFAALKRNDLAHGPLVRLVAARRFDLYQDPMPDLATFEGYAGETASTLLQYAAAIANGGQVLENGDAAGHLGVAQALVGHIRAFGYYAARGRIFLPMDIMSAHGVTEPMIFVGTPNPAITAAIAQCLEIASEHLIKANAAIAAAPKTVRPAFAPAGIVKSQLKALKRRDNPFAPPADLSDLRKLWALWRAAR